MNENNAEINAGSNTSNTSPAPTEQEKLLKQSEVNDIVGRTRHDAYERGKSEALSEYKKQQDAIANSAKAMPAPAAQSGPIAQQTPNIMGGMPQYATLADVQQELNNREMKAQAQNVANMYFQKMSQGRSKYQDFDTVVNALQPNTMPEIVDLATRYDNTDEIMYDLGKNPAKLATLRVLALTNPQLAMNSLNELSSTIKANQAAAAKPHVNEPLSKVQPSNVGADNGSKTIADLRKMPWLKA